VNYKRDLRFEFECSYFEHLIISHPNSIFLYPRIVQSWVFFAQPPSLRRDALLISVDRTFLVSIWRQNLVRLLNQNSFFGVIIRTILKYKRADFLISENCTFLVSIWCQNVDAWAKFCAPNTYKKRAFSCFVVVTSSCATIPIDTGRQCHSALTTSFAAGGVVMRVQYKQGQTAKER